MSDLAKRAAEALIASDRQFKAQTISYTQGATSESFTAVKGRSPARIDNASGAKTSEETDDFLIEAADFADAFGAAAQPQARDQIGWNGQVYDVTAPNLGEPCWRWSDQYRLRMRVHTKRTGAT